MRSYEWRAADSESRPKCRISDVRNIDHHSKAIQFPYDVFSKISQAVVFRGADVRIGPIRVHVMCERQISDPEICIDPKCRKAIVDHVAAFHSHQRGDLPIFVRLPNLICSEAKGNLV